MMALTLRQPWAHAVVHLGKSLENRRWNTHFRGTFLIHAAKGMTLGEYEDAVDFCDGALGRTKQGTSLTRTGELPGPKALPFGGIVGRARLVGVLPPCASIGAPLCPHPWHMHEQYGFLLSNIEPLPFVPCKGALGFWPVPADVMAQIGVAA